MKGLAQKVFVRECKSTKLWSTSIDSIIMNILRSLAKAVPLRVSSGPFRGVRCEVATTGDGVVAKLAGTYEMEIYPAFMAGIARRPGTIVDIGAAEGFYVSALARTLPEARLIAYEAKPEWRERLKHRARVNGVEERCEIRGFCDAGEFRRLLKCCRDELNSAEGGGIFILMDIEGGEFSLLAPEMMPLLRYVELLVELHEPESRLQGDALVAMLGESHNVEVIWAKQHRKLSDIPSLGWRLAAILLPAVRRRLDEGRAYHMRWLHAVPKL
jgi:hypothetical protein